MGIWYMKYINIWVREREKERDCLRNEFKFAIRSDSSPIVRIE